MNSNKSLSIGIGIVTVIVIIGIIIFASPPPPPTNIIIWNETRPLTWDDFQGEPDEESEHTAYTAYGIDVGDILWREEIIDGECFIVLGPLDPVTTFNKTASWKKGAPGEGLLEHEQKHFDLTEIFNRKLKERYDEGILNHSFPCPEPEGDELTDAELTAEAERIVKKLYDEIWDELRQKQSEYDDETDHGTDPEKQQEWCDWIEEQLSDD